VKHDQRAAGPDGAPAPVVAAKADMGPLLAASTVLFDNLDQALRRQQPPLEGARGSPRSETTRASAPRACSSPDPRRAPALLHVRGRSTSTSTTRSGSARSRDDPHDRRYGTSASSREQGRNLRHRRRFNQINTALVEARALQAASPISSADARKHRRILLPSVSRRLRR